MQTRSQTNMQRQTDVGLGFALPQFESGAEVVFREGGKSLRGWSYSSSPTSVVVLGVPDEFAHSRRRTLFSVDYNEHRVTLQEKVKITVPTLRMPEFCPGDRVAFNVHGFLERGEVIESFRTYDDVLYDDMIQVQDEDGCELELRESNYAKHMITLLAEAE